MQKFDVLYKKIFPNGSPTDPLHSQTHFIEHVKKLSVCLNDIRQDADQKKALRKHTVNLVLSSENSLSQVSNEEIKNFYTLPSNVRKYDVDSFCDQARIVVHSIRFKDEKTKLYIFKHEFEELTQTKKGFLISEPLTKALKENVETFDNAPLKSNINYSLLVENFAYSLDRQSLRALDLLIDFAHYNELTTLIVANPKVAVAVGFKLYVFAQFALCEPEAFQVFLLDVKHVLENPVDLPGRIGKFAVDHKRQIATTLTITLVAPFVYPHLSNYFGDAAKIIGSEGSKYLPAPGTFFRASYETIKQVVGSSGFMLSSLFAEFRKSIFAGAFADLKVPKEIQEGFKKFLQNSVKTIGDGKKNN